MRPVQFQAYGALRYGPERVRKARRLRRAGKTYAEIGARLGVTRQRAHQLLNASASADAARTKGQHDDHH